MNNAVAAGITVLASSGNNSWVDSIQCPACISGVISVGATNRVFRIHPYSITRDSYASIYSYNNRSTGNDTVDKTTVIPFSNTSLTLDILAPSNWNYTAATSIPSQYSSSEFGDTSSACGYAAGVVACLQSAAKYILGRCLKPDEVRKILITTGDYITDAKVNITRPQINLDRAIDSLVCNGKTFSIYNDGPGALIVSMLTTEKSSSWLSFWPKAPFVINSGEYQEICVKVKRNCPCLSDRLLVFSNDSNNNPYPEGVFVNVMNGNSKTSLDVP
ncbi:MAG: S8 family serine peptidase [Planctomycetota bacterium]